MTRVVVTAVNSHNLSARGNEIGLMSAEDEDTARVGPERRNHESGKSLVKLAKDREAENLKAEIPSNPSAGGRRGISEGMETGG